MRRLLLVLLCLALVGAAAGCAGGGDEAADEEPSATVQPVDETTTDELDTTAPEGIASEECLELISIGAVLSQTFTGSGSPGAEESAELFAELVAKAPDEIKADLEIVASGFSEYVDALRDLELQEGAVPSAAQLQEIQAALASIDQPELQAASERLSAWAEENC